MSEAGAFDVSELDLDQVHNAGDYGSEFEYDSEADKSRSQHKDLAEKPRKEKHQVASKQLVTAEYDREEGRIMRYHILSMDAFSRHKKLVNDYVRYFGGSLDDLKRDASNDKTDLDVIHENHRFLWSKDDNPQGTWEKRMAKKYYDKLYKEYCISDLSRYKENKIAMRWRVEKEVIFGKGQFICGNKKCEETDGLKTWEVNFGYVEHDEKKNALVKLRLCVDCSYKLNYHHKRKEVIRKRQIQEDESVNKKQRSGTSDSDAGRSRDYHRSHDHPSSSTERSHDHHRSRDHPSSSTERSHGRPSSSTEKSHDHHKSGEGSSHHSSKNRPDDFDEYFEDMIL